jgi:lysyl-tRNA synthetase class 2
MLQIRAFFQLRSVLEVETPLLSHATVTDLHLQSFSTEYHLSPQQKQTLYLQTSPEFAMKRLLAAGSGPIYQICKAFRNGGESGRYHNPEFTLLEWYRPGFNHHALMDEIEALLQTVLHTPLAERISYQELFYLHTNVNPHTASLQELQAASQHFNIPPVNNLADTRDNFLFLLMTHVIEPALRSKNVVFIYDFPASQAGLAKVRQSSPPVAERFEVYINGIELANGFHELTDATEQEQRFNADLELRAKQGYPEVPIDQRLLAALKEGLSPCAGVALGLDRLIMLALAKTTIDEVISFPISCA